MTRRAKVEHASGFTVLLVDDNPDYLQATRLLLEREGHLVLTATNGAEALSIVPQQRVDLLLLDYFMPGMTGEQVVAELRRFDPFIQVILQTGYASEQPPRELLQRLNIQGYYDKTEGPEQLLLWTTVGLKAAVTTQLLFKTRTALSLVAATAPKLYAGRGGGEPIRETLVEVGRLAETLLEGASPHAFIATLDGDAELHVRGGTGVFAHPGPARQVCTPTVLDALLRALEHGDIDVAEGTVFPLRAGADTLGALYVDQPIVISHVRDALQVLASQAAVAIHSARVAERAAVDVLTDTQTRQVFERSLLSELRAAFRAGTGVALVLVAVDGHDAIDPFGGRTSGDRAMSRLGRALRKVCRAEDVIGRYSGDAFGVVFRNTLPEGPERMSARLFAALGSELGAVEPELRAAVSVGSAAAPPYRDPPGEVARPLPASYFASMAELLKATAAAALGEVQRAGGSAAGRGALVNWPRL